MYYSTLILLSFFADTVVYEIILLGNMMYAQKFFEVYNLIALHHQFLTQIPNGFTYILHNRWINFAIFISTCVTTKTK